MRNFIKALVHDFIKSIRKADLVLLSLCAFASCFSCLMVASATNATGSLRNVIVQIIAMILGIFLYLLVSNIDADFFSEYRVILTILSLAFISMLWPFGVNIGGNRSWIPVPLLGMNVQPAEFCKISFILIMASVMASHQRELSKPYPSIVHIGAYVGVFLVLNIAASGDWGVSLIFVAIFVGMAWTAGVSKWWFFGAISMMIVGIPVVWPHLPEYQRQRIEVIFNPDLDPSGIGIRYHTIRSLRSLTGGGLTGQGLFNGIRTQTPDVLPAQHTDYIFSAIGEELGYVGCVFVLILLFAIVIRCIWVGNRSGDFMRKLICYGAASALMFQTIVNIGMCIGIMPVIGLTLPFMSYGGSSLVTLYAMVGLVSGVYARPDAPSHQRYVRPPNYSRFQLH